MADAYRSPFESSPSGLTGETLLRSALERQIPAFLTGQTPSEPCSMSLIVSTQSSPDFARRLDHPRRDHRDERLRLRGRGLGADGGRFRLTLSPRHVSTPRYSKPRTFSAEARQRMSLAAKRRWKREREQRGKSG